MLLRALKDYYEREAEQEIHKLPPFYSITPIRYVIALDGQGTPMSPRPIDTADPSDRRARRGHLKAAPQVVRAYGIKPLLMADKADYALGYLGPDGKPDRVAACHRAFVDLVERCARETGSTAAHAVLGFVTENPLARLDLPDDFDPGGIITFTVDEQFPIDDPYVQRFWAGLYDPASRGGPLMQCVVCGLQRHVLERLPGKVKGVPGGQTAGTSLVSANARAFESYGLTANLTAPMCSECAEGFTRGLNGLLSDDATRVVVGSSVFVFWTRRPTTFSFRSAVIEARPEAVRALLESVRDGQRMPEVEPNSFYATILSGSGGRAVVRDWIDTTVERATSNAALWHERQRIVDPWGEEWRPLGIYALAMTTVREQRDLSPVTPRMLLRVAITGDPLPWTLLEQLVRRCRAEQKVDRPHAAMIKLVLLSRSREEGDVMVGLNEDHPSPAYQCGRLFAVLESAQRAALGEVGAGIVDRFYGTASSAPLTVFPRLLRGVQPHLGKLERDRPAASRAIQDRLADVLTRLDTFPTTLNIGDQGLFALGFYHQRADDRARMKDAAERKRQADTPIGATSVDANPND